MQEFINWATNSEYFVMWCIYMAGAIGLIIVCWRITRSWVDVVRLPLRIVFACLLLIPVSASHGSPFSAPAFIVGPFEWLVAGPDAAGLAISALIRNSFFVLVFLVLYYGGKYAYQRFGTKA